MEEDVHDWQVNEASGSLWPKIWKCPKCECMSVSESRPGPTLPVFVGRDLDDKDVYTTCNDRMAQLVTKS